MPQLDSAAPTPPGVDALLSELDAHSREKSDAMAKAIVDQAVATKWHAAARIGVPATLFAVVCLVVPTAALEVTWQLSIALSLGAAVFVGGFALPAARRAMSVHMEEAIASAYSPIPMAELDRVLRLVEPFPELTQVVRGWGARGIPIRKHEASMLERAVATLRAVRASG